MDKIVERLRAGDRRRAGPSEVVALVRRDPRLCADLAEGLLDPEPGMRMRCADVLEKVTAHKPRLLQPYKDVLLHRVSRIEQQEIRWHLAQMLPRLELNAAERTEAVALLRGFLADESSIVKTFAMQALADFAGQDADLREEVKAIIERLTRAGTPAMKARGRKLLARFAKM